MSSQKTIKLYIYVDGVNDVPFYGSDAGEYEEFILANGEQYTTSEGFVFNVRKVNEQIELGDFRYDAKRMGGAPTITCTLMYEDCLDDFWSENVYAEFNGEKYFLKQTPTSSYNNESTMYKHDLELVSERVILDNVYFFDAVVGEPQGDDKPVSNSTKVVFFGNIHEFVKRLNSSLEYAKLLKWEDGVDENGNEIKIPNGYHVVVDDDNNITKEERLMSFEDQFFSNVLQEIYNTYEVPYYFEGKTIHIGYSNKNAVVPTFSYGVDDALLSITKNNANYKIVNRATAIGSSDNIPFYYPNNSPKGEIAAEHSRKGASVSIIDAERYANKISLDGVIKYEDFSITEESMTSEYGAYESGEEIFLNKITGSTTRDFNLTFFASNAGKLTLNLDYTIDSVRNPIKGSSLSSDTISCRFTVTLYKVRGDSVVVAKSVQSGSVEVPITSMGNYVAKITMEFASRRADNALTCNYKLHYSFDEGFTGWTYEGKEINLSDIGLSVGDAVAGDTITQKLVKYVKTSQNLMPSIYRETDGEERFYNATNDTYEGVEFNNPYIEGKPKEHIFTVDDIKPTIKETEVNGLRIDMFSEFAYDDDDNDDTIENENGDRDFVHSYFFAKLRKLDFNLFDHAIENQPMTISFTSGDCGACNFEIGVTEEFPQKNPVQVNADGTLKRDEKGRVICGQFEDITEDECQPQQQDTINNEVWIALKKEETTYGILMPKAPKFNDAGEQIEAGHRPKACSEGQNDGDTFVILGINLPQSYITNAEKKLEAEIIKYLQDNNDEKFTFSIGFSRIYFEENDVLDQLSENSKIAIMYNGQLYDLYVSSFSYSMSEGDVLPEIRVELDETLKVSQNALQNAISQVKSELGRAIGSIDVVGAATPYFIRKDADDEAQGRINFKKGIKFGEGGKVEILDNNSAKLTIEYLEVTKKASFTSLEIKEKTHVGGQIIISPAAMTCGEVEELENAYRCYFQTKNSEGNDEIFNQFAENDLAICQTYNAWGSRYYWRKVVGIGEDYIDLSKTLCDEYSDIPMAGDKIVQLGNTEDITRQAAIVLSAYGDDAPSFIMYNGINDFTLVEKNITGIIWNPKTLEPQMYSYGSFFFGDRQLNKNFITFQKKEGDTDKNLYINGKVTIGAGSEGLDNLSEWSEKQAQINNAQETANNAISQAGAAKDDIAKELGYADYNDMKEQVSANGSIIMEGGYLNAELIEANSIVADQINTDNLVVNQVYAAGGKTTIDADGNLTSVSGKIGGFDIGSSFLSSTRPDYSVDISSAVIELQSNQFRFDDSTVNTKVRFQAYPTIFEGGYALARLHSTLIQEPVSYERDKKTNTALSLSATGAYDAKVYSDIGLVGGNFAIMCHNGVYGGFRPMTRTTSLSTILTIYDHTLLVNNNTSNANVGLTLPNWTLGQEYEIIMIVDYITIKSSTSNIHLPEANSWGQSSVTISGWGGIVRIYAARDKDGAPFWFVFKIK